ncbi:hypothetical protein AAFA46_04700 [Oscillospiraceae bacterium WX1]
MKKLIAALMASAMLVSLLSGCVRIPKNTAGPSTSDNTRVSSPSPSNAKSPSDGYSAYMDMKGDAIDRISNSVSSDDPESLGVAMTLVGYSMMDMSMLWLTAFTQDAAVAQSALAMMGVKDVKVTGSGNNYSITYSDSDGKAVTQTCQYDPAKDQLTSTLKDADGTVTMFFEYINLGGAYAAQYYYPDENGTYQVIRSFFDKDNIAAFGTLTATAEPDSIIGKSSLNEDFVVNSESYIIFKDGELTTFDQGGE